MADGVTAPEFRTGEMPRWVLPTSMFLLAIVAAAMVKGVFDESEYGGGTIVLKDVETSDSGESRGGYNRSCDPSPTGFHEYDLKAGDNGILTGTCKWCKEPY